MQELDDLQKVAWHLSWHTGAEVKDDEKPCKLRETMVKIRHMTDTHRFSRMEQSLLNECSGSS